MCIVIDQCLQSIESDYLFSLIAFSYTCIINKQTNKHQSALCVVCSKFQWFIHCLLYSICIFIYWTRIECLNYISQFKNTFFLARIKSFKKILIVEFLFNQKLWKLSFRNFHFNDYLRVKYQPSSNQAADVISFVHVESFIHVNWILQTPHILWSFFPTLPFNSEMKIYKSCLKNYSDFNPGRKHFWFLKHYVPFSLILKCLIFSNILMATKTVLFIFLS